MKPMSQAPVNDLLTYLWEGRGERTSTGCSVFPFAFLRMRGLPYTSVVRAICKILTWLRMHWKAESPSVSAAELGCGWSVTTVDPLEEAARCVRAHRGNRWHHVSAPISVGAKQMVLCKFLNWIPILKLQLLTNPEPHSRQVIINICYPPPLLPRLSSCSINTGISSRTSSSLKLNIISTCIQHADECRTFIIS